MTRTHDLLITNQLLYRLSYTSAPGPAWSRSFDIISDTGLFVNPLCCFFQEISSLPAIILQRVELQEKGANLYDSGTG